jgi:hypothetical protein
MNNGETLEEIKDTANKFNTYFSNTNAKPAVRNTQTSDPTLNYLHKVFNRPFPCMINVYLLMYFCTYLMCFVYI